MRVRPANVDVDAPVRRAARAQEAKVEAVIPIDLDHREDHVDGLFLFITTNVLESRPLTRRELENSFEDGMPWMYTRQFELGPEDMFAAAV